VQFFLLQQSKRDSELEKVHLRYLHILLLETILGSKEGKEPSEQTFKMLLEGINSKDPKTAEFSQKSAQVAILMRLEWLISNKKPIGDLIGALQFDYFENATVLSAFKMLKTDRGHLEEAKQLIKALLDKNYFPLKCYKELAEMAP